MRERRTSERTALKGNNVLPKKKYFLVFEGVETEEIYFRAFKETYMQDKLIEIIPLIRNNSEDGFSNPEKIFEMIQDNLKEHQEQNYKYKTLIDWIIDYIKEYNILNLSKEDLKVYLLKCLDVIHVKQEDSVDSDNLINQLTELIKQFKNFVMNKFCTDINELVKSIIEFNRIEYFEGFDQIAIIVDRDRDSFSVKQYEGLVKSCSDSGYKFIVTNPCFEFWLMMHFNEVRNIDKDKMLNNPKVNSDTTYCHSELKKLMPGYKKNKYDAVMLMTKIKTALKNEKMLCEDIIGLKTRIGSNVGKLIEEFGFEK